MTRIHPALARQYVQWFQRHEPFWFRVAQKRHMMSGSSSANVMHGLGAIDWGGVFNNIVTTVKDAVPAYLSAKQQKEIMDMQLERAKQGLPPADISNYTPSIKVEPNINPETEKAITRVASETLTTGFKKLLPWGIGLIGGLLFFRH